MNTVEFKGFFKNIMAEGVLNVIFDQSTICTTRQKLFLRFGRVENRPGYFGRVNTVRLDKTLQLHPKTDVIFVMKLN